LYNIENIQMAEYLSEVYHFVSLHFLLDKHIIPSTITSSEALQAFS